ncbi:hypothetical protein V1478_017206 [Vespula squamosa]|uniref:Uncharacterized protein n=1 Tax=Vespula squamosa TaxID=30214 RepID=A0ABD1ZYR0_VESSQ
MELSEESIPSETSESLFYSFASPRSNFFNLHSTVSANAILTFSLISNERCDARTVERTMLCGKVEIWYMDI